MDLSGLVFAFTAGIFSLVSPCGYALLPGYMSYYLGSGRSIGRAISGGLICTVGLVTVFSVIGVAASSLGALLPQLIPLLDLVAGAILILMGVTILKEVQLPYLSLPVGVSKRRGPIGLYIFGVAYGLAAVGCSAPIFLSVLFYAMARGLASGTLTFVTYALGMGLPLIVTSILMAEAKEFLIGRITDAAPRLHKLSGVLLITVGVYLFYFYYVTYIV